MKSNNNCGRTLRSFLDDDVYVFPQKGAVPSGRYQATLNRIEESKSVAGNNTIDICYTLTDEHGTSYKVKQRMAENSCYLNELVTDLGKVGVDIDEIRTNKDLDISLTIDFGYSDGGYGQFEIVAPRKEFHPPKRNFKTLN